MVVGSVELLPLTDAVGVIDELGGLYPDVPGAAWEPYYDLYPELFELGTWVVPCKCYLVRAAGRSMLVDTGVGPPGLWDWTPVREGGLLGALAAHGIEPEHIDLVLLTHVHTDHVGWNTDRDGELVFPRARFLLHADAIAAARARAERPHIRRCLLPLLEGGIVDQAEDGDEDAPGVTVLALPGHDAGHVGLRIGDDAVLVVDAAVHPALFDEPDWRYAFDADPERCADTRRTLVAELADSATLVVSGHYPGTGTGHLMRSGGRTIWTEAPDSPSRG